jgi:hypothetical protein
MTDSHIRTDFHKKKKRDSIYLEFHQILLSALMTIY